MEVGERTTPARRVAENRGRQKFLKRVLFPLTSALGLAVVFLLLRPICQEETVVSSPKPLVVMPFENQTGDESLDYLKTAIPNLLLTNLEQSKYLTVLTWERMQDLLKVMGEKELEVINIDKNTGFELCRADGVHGIVLGSFTKAGDVFATDIKVLDVGSKRLLQSANARGEGVGSILKKQIDELTEAISRSVVMLTDEAEAETFKVTAVTTESIEAYQNYRDGIRKYNMFDYIGGRISFGEAVKLDTTFAMAHYRLARANSRLGNRQDARRALERAMTYSVKATDREALYIEMEYAAVVEKNADKSLRVNEELVQRFPKEKEAFQRLGAKHRAAGRYEEAIKAYSDAIALDPNWGYVYNSIGYAYAFIGEYEKALVNIERYVSLSPEGPNPLDSMGELFLITGRLDEAIVKLELASEKYPNWYGTSWVTLSYVYALKENYEMALRQYEKLSAIFARNLSAERDSELLVWTYRNQGLLYYIVGRYKEARDLYRKQARVASRVGNDFGRARAHELTAFIDTAIGEFMEAESELRQCLKVRSQISPEQHLRGQLSLNYISGFFEVNAGKTESAKAKLELANDLLPKIKDRSREIYANWAALLAGEIALAEGFSDKAIKLFRQAIPPNPFLISWWDRYLYSLPVERDGLARAYYAAGDLDNAIAEYKRLTTFNPDSKERFLIDPKYHYQLARLYEKKGWGGLAMQEYERFLEIWQDADEDLLELLDAKTRLAELQTIM
jgi:tetratricopeptide (TPR) repeat protein